MRLDHLLLVVAALCVLILLFNLGNLRGPSPFAPERIIESLQQRKPPHQRAWERRLKALINKRIFKKVEWQGGAPQVWVGPEFYALDFIAQWEVVGEVYSYYVAQDSDVAVVLLYDGRSGDNIGSFSTETGLQMK